MTRQKILWVVNYDHVKEFADQAQKIGATGVAIRTDNDMTRAIPEFHGRGMKVFGWRWPSAKRDAAMREADKVAALLGTGLDGYYVDPEGEPGASYDWDQPGLDALAADFCKTIVDAARGKPFGVTSHYRAMAVFPKLPWKTFFRSATVLLPQSYWRTENGVIGHGIPDDNYRKGIEFWTQAGGRPEQIVPMAGELAYATSAEIETYVSEARHHNIDDLHFYTATDGVKAPVWQAISAA